MNHKKNNTFKEAVILTAQRLNLPEPAVVEKDFYVTKAIHRISDIESEYFKLVFQGGTCLAKAHRLIQRMSEDSDWRIQAKPDSLRLSKEKKRKHLRQFRHEIVNTLKKDFMIINKPHTRNEGQFMGVNLQYDSIFSRSTKLRPHLQMEFFLNDVKLPPEQLTTTTLIRQTLGKNIDHDEKAVNCIAITETAAEKWVALTRRIATIKHRPDYQDVSLVRHIYDLYQIQEKGRLNNEFYHLITDIVEADRNQFKNHNQFYTKDPVTEIKRAIHLLKKDETWQKHWDNFMEAMVYQSNKPTYKIACILHSNPITDYTIKRSLISL